MLYCQRSKVGAEPPHLHGLRQCQHFCIATGKDGVVLQRGIEPAAMAGPGVTKPLLRDRAAAAATAACRAPLLLTASCSGPAKQHWAHNMPVKCNFSLWEANEKRTFTVRETPLSGAWSIFWSPLPAWQSVDTRFLDCGKAVNGRCNTCIDNLMHKLRRVFISGVNLSRGEDRVLPYCMEHTAAERQDFADS